MNTLNSLGKISKQLLKEAATCETGTIDIMYMLGSIHIQMGSSFAHDVDSSDEDGVAELKSAINQLQTLGFVINAGNDPESYSITNKGKRVASEL